MMRGVYRRARVIPRDELTSRMIEAERKASILEHDFEQSRKFVFELIKLLKPTTAQIIAAAKSASISQGDPA